MALYGPYSTFTDVARIIGEHIGIMFADEYLEIATAISVCHQTDFILPADAALLSAAGNDLLAYWFTGQCAGLQRTDHPGTGQTAAGHPE